MPVAFIPGISGELFRQFAVTVAVSMFISAINALTLSPALCGVFLEPHHGPRRGLIGKVMGAIDYVRDSYGAAVARIVRFSAIGLVLVGVAAFGTTGSPVLRRPDSCRRTTRVHSLSWCSCRGQHLSSELPR